ncbi:MAG TPA: hypothetical protein VH352_02740 [Pseudonocardiaceae bacterium]|nr:hypothetical protein [Pseudonocardiaceae bacterium]
MRRNASPSGRFRRLVPVGALVTAGVLAATATSATATTASAAPRSAVGCVLSGPTGPVRHVIYLQFDNTHFTRDNPAVPSDLEQMPNLLNFVTGNGTLVSHEHTPLISHTADDIVTSETGLYGDRHGMPIANSYNYFVPDGTTHTAGSFAYWTDPMVDFTTPTSAPVGDASPSLVGPSGGVAPAPWVPYTRAGCDFGTVAAANTELENTVPDVPVVYGANSPQAKEAEDPNQQNKAAADFEGLAVHCARTSACASAANAMPDVLSSEPRGYNGFKALYGNVAVQPLISPSGPVRDLSGNVINDGNGDVGFPGYNAMTGPNALSYTLDMQLHGVPVTYTYLTDLHESWQTGNPFGPGEAGYVQQARTENAAFGTFFTELAAHGITKANTLFVITADEGDHFVGGPASPAGCDGIHVPCTYSTIGEVDGNLTGLLAAKGVTTPTDVSADSAPALYVHGQPARTTTAVRQLARTAATLTAPDLATGKTVPIVRYLADPVEERLLHLVTSDPKRTPSLVLFGNDDFWLTGGDAACGASCVSENPSEAWNHGDVQPQITTTWLGLVGPGVARNGVDGTTWSDHTDIRPTMMNLLGLHDDYTSDGRVLLEDLDTRALPPSVRAHRAELIRLGQLYTQLNAAVGEFGIDTLMASTVALRGNSPGDRDYVTIENGLQRLGTERDAVVAALRDVLTSGFDSHATPDNGQAGDLTGRAKELLGEARQLAG